MSDFDDASRTRSIYAKDRLLRKIERERDRMAGGDLRRRPSFNHVVNALLERALGDDDERDAA